MQRFGYCRRRGKESPSFNFVPQQIKKWLLRNRSTNVEFWISAPLLALPC